MTRYKYGEALEHSMRFLILVMFLLCLNLALAAEVTEKGSGIVRGSIAYTFDYDPDDPGPTIIQGIRQSDVISVITDRTSTGVVVKFELYFKSRIDNKWGYEVIKGERGLSIGIGEQASFDVNKDGTLDITMEFTAYDPVERGTITIFPYAPVEVPEELNDSEEENEIEEPYLTEKPKIEPNETEMDKAGSASEQDSSVVPVFITVLILLMLAVVGWFMFNHDLLYEKQKKKTKKRKTKKKDEFIQLDDLESSSKLPQMVTRSPRKRTR